MAFDAHLNFALGTVLIAPSPQSSGTSMTLSTGDAVHFPSPPFNATVYPVNTTPSLTNAEIVRVTSKVGEVLTIVRGQESSNPRNILVGDKIALNITAKTITDVENAIPVGGTYNIPNLADSGTVTGLGLPFAPSFAMLIVRAPSGGLNLYPVLIDATLTADGFSFSMNGQTDSANYKLDFLLLP